MNKTHIQIKDEISQFGNFFIKRLDAKEGPPEAYRALLTLFKNTEAIFNGNKRFTEIQLGALLQLVQITEVLKKKVEDETFEIPVQIKILTDKILTKLYKTKSETPLKTIKLPDSKEIEKSLKGQGITLVETGPNKSLYSAMSPNKRCFNKKIVNRFLKLFLCSGIIQDSENMMYADNETENMVRNFTLELYKIIMNKHDKKGKMIILTKDGTYHSEKIKDTIKEAKRRERKNNKKRIMLVCLKSANELEFYNFSMQKIKKRDLYNKTPFYFVRAALGTGKHDGKIWQIEKHTGFVDDQTLIFELKGHIKHSSMGRTLREWARTSHNVLFSFIIDLSETESYDEENFDELIRIDLTTPKTMWQTLKREYRINGSPRDADPAYDFIKLCRPFLDNNEDKRDIASQIAFKICKGIIRASCGYIGNYGKIINMRDIKRIDKRYTNEFKEVITKPYKNLIKNVMESHKKIQTDKITNLIVTILRDPDKQLRIRILDISDKNAPLYILTQKQKAGDNVWIKENSAVPLEPTSFSSGSLGIEDINKEHNLIFVLPKTKGLEELLLV
ncbi:hypothetical protein GMMP15_2090003 [Candidatus Magnetomoraceae bacterium gMMP-15]